MLKAVLVLFMVSSCISRPKEYLIESKDQPGKETEPSTDWDLKQKELLWGGISPSPFVADCREVRMLNF